MKIDFLKIISSKIKDHNYTTASKSISSEKPIMQIAEFPSPLEIEKYTNPYSTVNPNGDYLSAYRFRDIVNQIPLFSKNYFISGNTVETTYGNLLNGVTILENSKFVSSSFYSASQTFTQSKLSGMSEIPSNWWLATASPNNWASLIQDPSNLSELTINLNDIANSLDNQFTIIDTTSNSLSLKSKANNSDTLSSKKLTSSSSLDSISFKYLLVQIHRNWFNEELFNMSDWYLEGQPTGYYSNGETTKNNGNFPLIITSLLIGTDVKIVGNLANEDINFLQNKLQNKEDVSLDVLPVKNITTNGEKSILSASDVYILGYISNLIPLSPKMSK